MKFDLGNGEYQIVPATEVMGLCMQLNGHSAMFHFRYANGKSATVEFSPKALDEFQPSKTVSQMMKEWEEGIEHRIEKLEKALASNIHPYWTATRKVMACHLVTKQEYVESHTTYEFPMEMNKDQKKVFTRELEREKSIRGKLICEKIV